MPFEANLIRALCSVIRHNGPLPAMLDDAQTFTWAEFGERVARLAGALRTLGIIPGSRYAIMSRNGFRMEELKWAGLWIGAVPVPVNWRLAPAEVAGVLEDAACRLVFAEAEFCKHFDHLSLASWDAKLVDIGRANGTAAPLYERLIERAKPVDPADPKADEDALLLYTGGTTGRSKGVRLSHLNILTHTASFGLAVGARRQQVYLNAAPMFHSGGLMAMAWLLQGAPQCYLPAFSPQAFLERIERYHVGAVVAVPTMLIDTVRYPTFAEFDVSSLRILVYGSAPMAAEWLERVADAFIHADIFNAYGLTEASPILTIFDAREFRQALAEARRTGKRGAALSSVGKANLGSEIRIIDDKGREVDVGEVGEIAARGPTIMSGYLNRPVETQAVLQDGWLRTGDVGRLDANGYLHVLDRLKDMVISGGENVYSAEVEGVLTRHPAVVEAAAIGVPDERLGETVMAVIVPAAGPLPSEEELTRHCREWLGGFKIPRRFAFVESLPKSALGKVLKAELRRQFSDTAPSAALGQTWYRREPDGDRELASS